jgi:glyoxylase I family protein
MSEQVPPRRPRCAAPQAGILNDDPGRRSLAHFWVGSKAAWFDIADTLPQFAAGPAEHDRELPTIFKVQGQSNSMRASIHHIDVTVSDLERSTDFYDRVLPLVRFRRRADVPEGPIWAGADVEIGLVAARSTSRREHDRHSPGLHHLAFAAPDRASVDGLHHRLVHLGVSVLDPPAEYPQYAPGYYAVFVADPDGIKARVRLSRRGGQRSHASAAAEPLAGADAPATGSSWPGLRAGRRLSRSCDRLERIHADPCPESPPRGLSRSDADRARRQAVLALP